MSQENAAAFFGVFRHLNTDNRDLYRLILGAFVDAKERFQVHLRPADVFENVRDASASVGAPTTVDSVTDALDQLVVWGNLSASPDTGRVVQVEDFYRKRHLFQLSREGEAVEKALRVYDESLGRRGSLQAVALEDIAVILREFIALVDADVLDVSILYRNVESLTRRFGDLADNASAFMSSLQRTIDLTETDEEVFIAYKSRLIEYLERFIRDLAVRGPQIAALLESLDAEKVDRALRTLAERDAAEAAPDPDDADARTELARAYLSWTNRWAGLRSWFLSVDARGVDTRDSQAKLLRQTALGAIPTLLDAVRAVNARRSGRSDRSADYLALAEWFHEAETDDDRHRLARAAFGLYPARHLTVPPETWQRWSDDPALAGQPWAQVPPIELSPQLRRTGSYERKGRANKIIDRSADRAALALKVRQQSEQITAARRRLATNGEVELRDLAGLDSVAFGLFLTLLGDALVATGEHRGAVHTASSDGTMSIDLTPIAGEFVALETERGTLWGPNHLVRIVDLEAGALEAGVVEASVLEAGVVDDDDRDDKDADADDLDDRTLAEAS
ncbi:MAG TPA: TIGR02677 family protein [Microbacteriaceae bacterium]